MKKIFLLAAAFALTTAAFAQPAPVKVDEVIKMNVETHDFGKIKQGIPVTYVFEIKNITKAPVVITNASASCGCTVPEKPEQPIESGKTAPLKVQFSAAAVGPINKDVYITVAGADAPKVVHITGEVLTPEAYEEYMKTQPKSKDDKPKN
ncbi:MAG: DUF1573 domain-containing protein [Chitinophagaceae bacterium]|nr:DUF1573 domain-containing protein [Chitinophagaceae bacterium]